MSRGGSRSPEVAHERPRLGRCHVILFLAFLLIALFAPRDGFAQPGPGEEARLAQARDALAAGAIDRVIALLDEPVESTPESFVPLLLEACRRGQHFARGRAWVEAFSNKTDASTPVILAIAQWEAEEGWVRRAAERLDRALEGRPGDAALWAGRARLARSEGDPATAWSSATTAIERGADRFELAWLRGEAALELGREEEGIAILRSLVAEQEGHLGARLSLARAARERGDRPRAITLLWQILELSPDHSAALGELGSLLVRTPEGKENGRRLLERFRAMRDRRERIERLIRERREGRDTPRLRLELARLLRLDGKPAVALSTARAPRLDAPEDSPNPEPESSDAALLVEAGLALRDLGQDRAALQSLGSALLADPSRDTVRLELANTLLDLGDPRRALGVLDRSGDRADPFVRESILLHAFARAGRPWGEIGPRLFALTRDPRADVEIARSFVDAAFGYEALPDALLWTEEWLEAEPDAPLARLILAWLLAEGRPEDPRLAPLETWWEERAASSPLGVEVWLWLAARCEQRGESAGGRVARQGARRSRAVFGGGSAGVRSATNASRPGH